ncbi:MAG: thiol reductant ABC exporter subunit CydD [Anaerolinea sp.]
MYMDRRLLRLAVPLAGFLAGGIFLAVLGGGTTILQALFFSQFVAGVFLPQSSQEPVARWLILLLVVVLLRGMFSFFSDWLNAIASARIRTRLRERLFAHLFRLGPVYTSQRPAGEVVTTLVEGVDALEGYFSQYLPQVVLSALLPLLVLATVFPLDPLSGVILTLTGPLIPVFMMLIGTTGERLTRRQFGALRRLSAVLLDLLQGLRTLKELGRSREQAQRVARLGEEYRRITLEVLRLTFLSALALEWLGTISTALIAVQVGLRLLYGHLEFSQAFFVLVIAPDFYLPLRTLGLRFHAAMNGISAAYKIFEVLEQPVWEEKPLPAMRQTAPVRGDIRLEKVTFTYPGREQPALNQITCRIPEGKVTALVGRSGSGKSTLAHLILRFLTCQEGDIWVGDLPLSSIPLEEWRKACAWVPQRPTILFGSVADNLRFADPNAGEERLQWALEQVHLWDWVKHLPQGLHTPVGERGAQLSGGQAQRLALARVMLRNPSCLVLDEPTSHLDLVEEALLQQVFLRLFEGRTVLLIAHRLPILRIADQILVLEKGNLEETGNLDELLQRGGQLAQWVHQYGGLA